MPVEQIPSIDTEHYRWNADGIELICIDFTTYVTAYNHSCQETHSNGYTCSPEVVSYTSTFCSWTNGGGGGGSSSGDSGSGNTTGGISGGGGSNGSSNNPSSPLITTPVGMDGIKIEQHILQLNKITDQNESGTNVLRNYIDQLYEELDNPLIEQGMEFKANLDGSYSAYPAQSAQYSGVRFFPVNVNNPLIRIHKHHTQLNPVFSAEDILGMMEFFMQKYNLNPSSAENGNISFIMVSETGVHALRVTSPSEAQEFGSYYSSPSGAQAFIDAYDDKVIEKSQDECGGTCSDEEYKNLLLQNFIAFFKEFVWGFAYYYAPHPANPTDNYNWTLQN